VVLAQEEARGLRHSHIGTEHLLLGLLRLEEGLAAHVLGSLGVTVERARDQVVRIVRSGEEVTSGQIPFTARGKKVLELALREAIGLGTNAVGTEHILLGLVREGEGVGARVLRYFDADAGKIRSAVVRAVSDAGPPAFEVTPPSSRTSPRHTSGFEQGIHVVPASALRRVLRGAAARALDDDRSEIELSDVLLAFTGDTRTARMFATLGVDETALREAIERDRAPREPPGAAAEA
jgi:ATP-dependent Clp protease ATP-binding subunit ClpA